MKKKLLSQIDDAFRFMQNLYSGREGVRKTASRLEDLAQHDWYGDLNYPATSYAFGKAEEIGKRMDVFDPKFDIYIDGADGRNNRLRKGVLGMYDGMEQQIYLKPQRMTDNTAVHEITHFLQDVSLPAEDFEPRHLVGFEKAREKILGYDNNYLYALEDAGILASPDAKASNTRFEQYLELPYEHQARTNEIRYQMSKRGFDPLNFSGDELASTAGRSKLHRAVNKDAYYMNRLVKSMVPYSYIYTDKRMPRDEMFERVAQWAKIAPAVGGMGVLSMLKPETMQSYSGNGGVI